MVGLDFAFDRVFRPDKEDDRKEVTFVCFGRWGFLIGVGRFGLLAPLRGAGVCGLGEGLEIKRRWARIAADGRRSSGGRMTDANGRKYPRMEKNLLEKENAKASGTL